MAEKVKCDQVMYLGLFVLHKNAKILCDNMISKVNNIQG